MILATILKKTTIRTKRALMYYLGAMNFMLVYTILAYSIAVFLRDRFPENDSAIFLVGIILGMASVFALFVDNFWAYLQKIYPPRKLILYAIVGLSITVSIFFSANFFEQLRWTLFTVVAAFSYGWSYDLYEITMMTLIFKRSSKAEYAQAISEKKVSESLGMMMGIILGGILLYFGSSFAQAILLLFLFFLFAFFKYHFDREEDDIELQFSEFSTANWVEVFAFLEKPEFISQKIQNTKESLQEEILKLSKETAEKIKKMPKKTKRTLLELLENARIALIEILSREGEIVRTKIPQKRIPFREMTKGAGSAFTSFFSFFSLFRNNPSPGLLWSSFAVMFFSFWDTMAITFQPLFLARYHDSLGILSSFLMLFFILPIFFLQVPLSKLADRIGHHVLILFGIFLSGISLLFMGFLDSFFSGSATVLVLAGVGNSIGYAAAFVPAQAKFAEEVQKKFLQEGKIIESEEMSAPLRILLNIGNILGQMIGGLVFAFFGFLNGFLFYGLLLLGVTFFSVFFYGSLSSKSEPFLGNEP